MLSYTSVGGLRTVNTPNMSLTKSNTLYQHFSTNGHTHADLLIYGIEKVHGDDYTLAARERYYIDKFETIYKGLNSNRT